MRRAPSASMGTPRIPADRRTIASQFHRVVEVEPADEAEPVTQRTGDQSGAGGGTDQGEPGQVESDAAGRRTLADEDVELEVLHGRIEDLLDRAVHPVDLVDEEDVTLLEVGEQGGQVAGPHQYRSGRHPQSDAQLGGHDAGQRGLAQSGRAGEQEVVGGLVALERRLDDDLQVFGQLALADELAERARSQSGLVGLLGRRGHRVHRPRRVAFDGSVDGPSDSGSGVTAGQHLLAGVGRHRSRTSSRRAVRTSSSTGASSSTDSSAPLISSGP